MSLQGPRGAQPALHHLDWALVIATKDRIDALQVCITLALQQTRPPAEVIVIDASAGWEDHAAQIGAIMTERPDIRFRYLQADFPSASVQRNQGVAAAQAAILFLLDDDSFMYPDCAEQVMALYELDTKGVVGGIQTSAVANPPQTGIDPGGRKKQGSRGIGAGQQGHRGWLGNWLMTHLFLMNRDMLFIPYDSPPLSTPPVPAALAAQGATPTGLFHGYRMTFRRQAVLEEPFDELLRYYAAGEDVDASYRISRRYLLLTAPQARLHHFTAAGGRVDRFRTTILSALNQAVFLRRHAIDQALARRRYFALMGRRLLAEVLKDALSQRFDFPQARGILKAYAGARRIFAMSPETLAQWYPAEQARLMRR